MSFNKLRGIAHPSRADKSAVCAINRHLRMCYPRLRYPGYFVKVHYGGLAAELHPGLLLLESLSKLLKKSLALRCPIGDGCVYLSLPRVG